MKLANTCGDFGKYFTNLEDRIRCVNAAGFRYIDISFYDPKEYTTWDSQMPRVKALTDELGIQYVQAHSPGGNPINHDQNWQELLDSTIESIRCCGLLGIPNTVVHAGCGQGISKEEFFEKNKEFYTLLFPAMEKYGVNVLIENSTKANMGNMYYFLTGAEMKEFIDYVGHPLIHACWDTGHANIEGHQYQDIMDLGQDLYAIHFNDNRGSRDEHITPFCGTMSVDEVMNGLIDSGYRGCFTMECDSTIRPAKYWHGDRRPFPRDTRMANPPLAVAQAAEKFLYETGKCILQTYDLWED